MRTKPTRTTPTAAEKPSATLPTQKASTPLPTLPSPLRSRTGLVLASVLGGGLVYGSMNLPGYLLAPKTTARAAAFSPAGGAGGDSWGRTNEKRATNETKPRPSSAPAAFPYPGSAPTGSFTLPADPTPLPASSTPHLPFPAAPIASSGDNQDETPANGPTVSSADSGGAATSAVTDARLSKQASPVPPRPAASLSLPPFALSILASQLAQLSNPSPSGASAGREKTAVKLTRGTPTVTNSAAFFWNGGGSDDNWTTGGNWGGIAPGANASADVTFAGTTRLTPNLNVAYSVKSLTFASNAGAFTLGGANPLTLGAGGIANSSANLQTINTSSLLLSAAQTWNVGTRGLLVNAPLSGTSALSVTGAGALTLSGNNVGFTGGLTATALNGVNGVTGTVTPPAPAASTLTFSGANAAGKGAVTALGGTGGNSISGVGSAGGAVTVNVTTAGAFANASSFTLISGNGGSGGGGRTNLGGNGGAATLNVSASNAFAGLATVNLKSGVRGANNNVNGNGSGGRGGAVTLNASASNAFAGVTNVNLTSGNETTAGGTVTLNASASSAFAGLRNLNLTGGTGESSGVAGGGGTVNVLASDAFVGLQNLNLTSGTGGIGYGGPTQVPGSSTVYQYNPGGAGGGITLNALVSNSFTGFSGLSLAGGTGGTGYIFGNPQGTSFTPGVGGAGGGMTVNAAAANAFAGVTTFTLQGGMGGTGAGPTSNYLLGRGGAGGAAILNASVTNALAGITTLNLTGGTGGMGWTGLGGTGGVGGASTVRVSAVDAFASVSTINLTGGMGGIGSFLNITSLGGVGGLGGDGNLALTFSTTGNTVTTNAVLRLQGGANGISTGGFAGPGGGASVALNGNHLSVGGLDSVGTTSLTQLIVRNGGSVAGSITVGSDNGAHTFGGIMQNGGTGALALVKTGTGTFTLGGANTFTGTTRVQGGNLVLGNSLALQGSTLDYNRYGGNISFGTQTAATLGGLSGSQDLNLINASNQAVTLTVGSNNTSTTFSGALSGASSVLTKSGVGSLTLTGSSTFGGGTNIGAGKLVANGTALGTGKVTIAVGATLSVGEALNTSTTDQATSTLSVSSLVVAGGSSTPALTFNLGNNGISDKLNLTGTSGSTLAFSSSGTFAFGFSSATGSALGPGTYTLLTFSDPHAGNVSSLSTSTFSAVAAGNLSSIQNGQFAWTFDSNNNVTGLNFSLMGATVGGAAIPEPSALALLTTGAGLLGSTLVRRRKHPPK